MERGGCRRCLSRCGRLIEQRGANRQPSDEREADMIEDVIIIGGGPTGLMLACELRLAGTRAVVLERLAQPTGLSKALGISGRGVDLLDHRGLLERFRQNAPSSLGSIASAFHFGGIPIDLRRVAGEAPRFVLILQADTERLLAQRADELGVEVRRGVELFDLEQDANHVHVKVRTCEGEETLRARYVVGCDGASSTVRHLTRIGFPGLPPTRLLRLGDVKFAAPLDGADTWRDGRPPFPPLDHGYFRVITAEPYPENFDRNTPMTLDELRESVRRTTGSDILITEARWLSRFTDGSRQADQYREGRVLLAGDAAHIQLPAGGPGLSTGLGDAVNLGWKLAAHVQGWAPEGLLDSYHAERHRAGARVLMHTRAQGALLNDSPQTRALREVFAELLQDSETLHRIVDLLHGNDVRYTMGNGDDSHPLTGRFAPDLVLDTDRGRLRLAGLMHEGSGVFVDVGDGTLSRSAATWSGRVTAIKAACVGGAPADGLLIRPDGYVAWAGTHPAALNQSLRRWFGAPNGQRSDASHADPTSRAGTPLSGTA